MCDSCEEWFHLKCVGLKAPPPETDPWHCSVQRVATVQLNFVVFLYDTTLTGM